MKAIFVALAITLAAVTSVSVIAAHAQSTGPASYFCAKNPGAAQCQKPPVTTGGGTTGRPHGTHHKPPMLQPITGAGGTAPTAGTASVVTGLVHSPAQVAQLPLTGGGNPASPQGNNWLWLSALLVLLTGAGLRFSTRRA